ncbi:MAG: GNAT family N-acetyltransferase [Gammaproteobacteria bacterium]
MARWERLILETDVNLSMHPIWVTAIAQAKSLLERITVFLAWNNTELVAAIPYYRNEVKEYGLPLNAIEVAGNLICYHHEVVARGEHGAIMKALLAENEGWDVLRMQNVLSQSATEAAYCQMGKDIGGTLVMHPGESSPYIPIQKGWDDFLCEKSANFRSQLKRKEKKLRQLGELRSARFTSQDQVARLLADILVIERNSWKESSGMAISSNDAEHQYYARLLPFLAQRHWLDADVVYVDDRPIAYSLCYAFNGRVGQLKTSFDHSLREFSPGVFVNKVTIQRTFERQAREFDFLGDVMRHKLEWADRLREHCHFYLFSKRLKATFIGRIKNIIAYCRENRGYNPTGWRHKA